MDASVIEPRTKSGLDSGHGIALGLYGAQGWRFAAHTRKSVADQRRHHYGAAEKRPEARCLADP